MAIGRTLRPKVDLTGTGCFGARIAFIVTLAVGTSVLFGCGLGTKGYAASPSVNQRFNQLDGLNNSKFLLSDPPTRDIAHLFRTTYNELFATLQTSRAVAKLTGADVGLLFRAAAEVQFYTDDPIYVAHMELDLNVLRNRHEASDTQYYQLYQAELGSRLFAQARELEQSHKSLVNPHLHSGHGDVTISSVMAPVPLLRDESGDGRAGPTDLVLTPDGRVLGRRVVLLKAPAQVIVVISPLCHFAQGGIHDIESDPALGTTFQRHAIWLVPPIGEPSFESVTEWNRVHPRSQMTFAYSLDEWWMLDRWETPTFYFFKDGKLVSEIVGWKGQQSKSKIELALASIGLNH